MNVKTIFATILLFIILLLIGCNQNPSTSSSSINSDVTEQPQAGNSSLPSGDKTMPPATISSQIMEIAKLLEKGSEFAGREVIIEGKIVQECGSGCWFNLKDDTGIIYVDLAPSDLVIPQKVGSKATVFGKVAIKNGTTYIIGTKVEF